MPSMPGDDSGVSAKLPSSSVSVPHWSSRGFAPSVGSRGVGTSSPSFFAEFVDRVDPGESTPISGEENFFAFNGSSGKSPEFEGEESSTYRDV